MAWCQPRTWLCHSVLDQAPGAVKLRQAAVGVAADAAASQGQLRRAVGVQGLLAGAARRAGGQVEAAAVAEPGRPVPRQLRAAVDVGGEELGDGDVARGKRLPEGLQHGGAGAHVHVHQASLPGEHAPDPRLGRQGRQRVRPRLAAAVVADRHLPHPMQPSTVHSSRRTLPVTVAGGRA